MCSTAVQYTAYVARCATARQGVRSRSLAQTPCMHPHSSSAAKAAPTLLGSVHCSTYWVCTPVHRQVAVFAGLLWVGPTTVQHPAVCAGLLCVRPGITQQPVMCTGLSCVGGHTDARLTTHAAGSAGAGMRRMHLAPCWVKLRLSYMGGAPNPTLQHSRCIYSVSSWSPRKHLICNRRRNAKPPTTNTTNTTTTSCCCCCLPGGQQGTPCCNMAPFPALDGATSMPESNLGLARYASGSALARKSQHQHSSTDAAMWLMQCHAATT
jgi:hypothetical protein